MYREIETSFKFLNNYNSKDRENNYTSLKESKSNLEDLVK